jgi:hypothetical protein
MKLVDPFVIETDIRGNYEFFEPYMNQSEWTDTNILYDEYDEFHNSMRGRKMIKHYIKHINEYDMRLKKYILKIFKQFNIESKDWRSDFFLTKEGGSMPVHKDNMCKVALLLPLSENTGSLVCKTEYKEYELTYQTLTILNTQIEHGVYAPTKDRLLFRIALHDINFEELDVYKKLKVY